MNPEKQTEQEKRNKVIQELGARIAKSLFFWGMAAILASSAYTDLVRIWQGNTEAVQEMSAPAAEGTVPNEAEAVPDAGEVQDAETEAVQEAGSEDLKKLESAAADMAPADLSQKRIALTFDDGPHPVYTKKLLEGLAERHVEATFFVVGKNISGNEELLAQMQEEGHLIGNHTYDHVKICDMSGEEACEQVEKTSSLVKEVTGEDTEFVRPPFGAWDKEMECSFTMIPVMWDVDPLDWTTKNSAAVVQKVLNSVKENDIILLHDCYDSSVEAALEIVDELLARGYEFVTVDELILE